MKHCTQPLRRFELLPTTPEDFDIEVYADSDLQEQYADAAHEQADVDSRLTHRLELK